MHAVLTKPRLVFFQYRYDEHLPKFLLLHKQDHLKCLSHFFDLIVVNKDCAYDEICDQYQPDLTMFEGGVNHVTCHRLNISNTAACSHIPKLGLHNADAFCNARAGFLSDMDHWGINTFFAISTTAAEHTPEIANNLFVWPNFVDPDIYRDYGEWKSIPVLLTGNKNALYPWRQKLVKLVSDHYPSLLCPHSGYEPHAETALYGEHYARTISASSIVPACGTVAKDVVRKHFEIPACRACLITEQSSAVEAAGFVDMQNCIFADEHDVLDKLAHLFEHPDDLRRITDAGYQLVQSRHTLKQRDQILQWFKLYRNLAPDSTIVQLNPFGPLTIVPTSRRVHSHIIGNGLHLALLRQGDAKLSESHYNDAEHYYLKCMNYMPWMPEPRFKVALCNLYQGSAKRALSWIDELIGFILAEYKAIDPDPVEWAYSIISLLCLGKRNEAFKRACEFSWLHHPELDRARLIAMVLKGSGFVTSLQTGENLKRRWTIHHLPDRGFKEWTEQVCMMLRACGQRDWAETLKNAIPQVVSLEESQGGLSIDKGMPIWQQQHLDEGPLNKTTPGIVTTGHAFGLFKRRVLYRKIEATLRQFVSDLLHGLEAKYGYFLPYHLSDMRNDEFYHTIQGLTCEEEITTALILGAVSGEGSTEAFLAWALANEHKPSVFCVKPSRRRFLLGQNRCRSHPSARWYELPSSRQGVTEQVQKLIGQIRQDNQVKSFDAVLIDSSAFQNPLALDGGLGKELSRAKLVLLNDINHLGNHEHHHRLLSDPHYVLVAENPGLRNGYSIFKRRDFQESSPSGR